MERREMAVSESKQLEESQRAFLQGLSCRVEPGQML